MKAELTFKDGLCGSKNIRVKVWKSGFSIKCLKGKRTIVGRPYVQDDLTFDLAIFCDVCRDEKNEAKG